MIGCTCEVCRSGDRHDKRLRSSVMVEHFISPSDREPASRIIIDAGPDFRYQMLRENVMRIDAILLTHEHKDHVGGIDDVRAFNYWQDTAIPIYCTDRVAKIIKKDFDYAFMEGKYPGAPNIDLRIIEPHIPFSAGSVAEIMPVQGLHCRLPVLGYRIGNIAYITDFNYISDENIGKIKGVGILVINALRHEKHISHYTVSEAVEIARAVGAEKTYLTHMSHQVGLYDHIKRQLPEDVEFAYDRLKIETDLR